MTNNNKYLEIIGKNRQKWAAKNALTPLNLMRYYFFIFMQFEQSLRYVHTEKSFRNYIKSTRNQIVFTIFLDRFGAANGHYPFAIPNQSRKMVNTI